MMNHVTNCDCLGSEARDGGAHLDGLSQAGIDEMGKRVWCEWRLGVAASAATTC